MKRGSWIVLGLILALALGVFAAGCGEETTTTTASGPVTTAAPSTDTTAAPSTETTAAPTTDTTVAAGPIRMGIALSLTGSGAAPCEQIKQGFETEAKYVNANGGINGRQVELTFVDDQSKMDTAQAVIQQLIDQKMDVIIGPFPSWVQPPSRQLTEAAGAFQIAFGPPTIENLIEDQTQYTYSFAPATGPDGCADAYVKQMVLEGKKNVLVIADNMQISQEQMQLVVAILPMKGINVTWMSDTWSLEDTDLGPVANKLAAKAKEVNPDAILLGSNPVHVNIMTKLLRSLGVTVPIFNQGSGSHPLVMLAPAGNDPANVAGDFCQGPAIVDPSRIPDDYPVKKELNEFIARWKADYPEQPFASLFLGFAYDTFHLAEQAILGSATADADGYADAMEKVDWWGAQGHYVFSETDHIGGHGGFMQWQYTNGEGFKYVRDLNAMTDLYPETLQALEALKK